MDNQSEEPIKVSSDKDPEKSDHDFQAGGFNTADTPSDDALVNSEVNETGSMFKSLRLAALSLVGALVIGGSAFGAWYAYDNFFTTPDLSSLMLDSAAYYKNADTYQIDFELDMELNDSSDSLNLSTVANSFLGGLYNDSAIKKTINLKGTSYIDRTDRDNLLAENDIQLFFGVGMGELDLSSKLVSKVLYFKVNSLPAMLEAFVDTASVTEKWVSLDQNQKQGALDKYGDYFEADGDCRQKTDQFIKDYLQQHQVYEMVKECAGENVGDEKIINCRFRLSIPVLKNLSSELVQLQTEQCGGENLKKMEDADWDKLEKISQDTVFDVNFSQAEKFLTKLSVLYKNAQTSESVVQNAVLEIIVNNKVEKKNIIVPTDSIKFEDLLKQLFGAYMTRMQSMYSDEALSDSVYSTSTVENLLDKQAALDSDSDGLSDLDEVNKYFTDPNDPDTDADGYSDGDEVNNGYNPKGEGLLELFGN